MFPGCDCTSLQAITWLCKLRLLWMSDYCKSYKCIPKTIPLILLFMSYARECTLSHLHTRAKCAMQSTHTVHIAQQLPVALGNMRLHINVSHKTNVCYLTASSAASPQRPSTQSAGDTCSAERGGEAERRARENVSDSVHSFSISIIKTWGLILQLL